MAGTISRRGRIARPDGHRLTGDDGLPPPSSTRRWVPRLKFLIVAAVNRGLLSAQEACDLYGLSPEEFGARQFAIRRHGYDALKTTRVQKYRPTAMRRQMRRRRALARAEFS
jgi:hypothetical protein